jgi:hypothetical protein
MHIYKKGIDEEDADVLSFPESWRAVRANGDMTVSVASEPKGRKAFAE